MKILIVKYSALLNAKDLEERHKQIMEQINKTGVAVIDAACSIEQVEFDAAEASDPDTTNKRKPHIVCSNVGVTAGSELCNYCLIKKKCGALERANSTKNDMDAR